MKLIICILSLSIWGIVRAASETCTKPKVERDVYHIYRTADVDTDIIVYHCYSYYSDITENCINAFNTGLYVDIWNNAHNVNDTDSLVAFEKYAAKANIIQNKIRLKSGTTCRYDRGFCYDSKESFDFAVVWKVTREKPDIKFEDLTEIFYGFVDIWRLRNNSLIFLVFHDAVEDESFALRLEEESEIDGKTFWYTDRHGMLVYTGEFDETKPLLTTQEYFPLSSKQWVSEQILKYCDLQNFPLDFENNIYRNYALDKNNLVVILNVVQKQLLETKQTLAVVQSGDKGYHEIYKAITDLQKDLTGTKLSLLVKEQAMDRIRSTINDALLQTDSDVSKMQEEITQILVQKEGNDEEFRKMKEKLSTLQNQLSRLHDDSNEKKIDKEIMTLKDNFILLETKVSDRNKEIFKYLNSKDKLIDDTKRSLIDLSKKVEKKDIELIKGQETISNRVLILELEVERLGQLSVDLLTKLNLHDTEISKCQNHTTILLFNKDELLKLTDDIKKTQLTVQHLEEETMEMLKKGIALETNVYEMDEITTKLKDNITRECQGFVAMMNKNNNEMKMIKEKSEQCRRDVDHIMNSIKVDSEAIQKNITNMQNILVKRDEDILKLQDNLKEIYAKVNANYKDFTDAINDYRRQVNVSSQMEDEEISQIHDALIKKDTEIKKLYEYIDEKSRDTTKELKEKDEEIRRVQNNLIMKDEEFRAEIKKISYINTSLQKKVENISQIQDELIKKDTEIKTIYEHFKKIDEKSKDMEKKLKERDDEIKRIHNNLISKDEEFRAELNRKDQEYKKLEEKMRRIEEDGQMVVVN